MSSTNEESKKKIDDKSEKQQRSSLIGKRSKRKINSKHISKKKKLAKFPTTEINININDTVCFINIIIKINLFSFI